jgi:hypothetical protein
LRNLRDPGNKTHCGIGNGMRWWAMAMQPLTRHDLLALEAYALERPAFRARVLAHKRARRLALSDHLSLLFEDRLTVQYQVQEMLRIERIFEPDAIQSELDAYNPLIPSGRDLKATLFLEFPDPAQRARALADLLGIERRVYAEVLGHGYAAAFADEDHAQGGADKTSAVHFLRFAFAPGQIAALHAGAGLAVGIDDPRMPLRSVLPAAMHAALLHDFD